MFAGIPDPKAAKSLEVKRATSSRAPPHSHQQAPSSSKLPYAPFQVPSQSSSNPSSSQAPPSRGAEDATPHTPGSTSGKALIISDAIGDEAVNAAFELLVQYSEHRHPAAERLSKIIQLLVKILKEWTLGVIISRILGGHFPDPVELLDICGLVVDTQEVPLLFSTSGARPDPSLSSNIKSLWRQGKQLLPLSSSALVSYTLHSGQQTCC